MLADWTALPYFRRLRNEPFWGLWFVSRWGKACVPSSCGKGFVDREGEELGLIVLEYLFIDIRNGKVHSKITLGV